MQTATLALVHSTAEHCSSVWCRSAYTRLIDPTINNALRNVTGCLRPTPADNLPILAGIQPAELRHSGATLSLARRAMEPEHLLHSALTRPWSADVRRLKSRQPFVPDSQQLISSSDTLLQTMRLPLGESGVWGFRIPLAVNARWRRVGTTRIQASKHGSYWKVPATSLQLSCLGPTHATDHACKGAKMVYQRLRIFPPPQSSVAQFLLNEMFPFYPERPAAGI